MCPQQNTHLSVVDDEAAADTAEMHVDSPPENEWSVLIWTGGSDDAGENHGIGSLFCTETNREFTVNFSHGHLHTHPDDTHRQMLFPIQRGKQLFKGLIQHGELISGVIYDVRHGDRLLFKGDFKNGLARYGTVYYYDDDNDGASWYGQLLPDTTRTGSGILTYKDGATVCGVWYKDDLLDGEIQITLPNDNGTTFVRTLHSGTLAVEDSLFYTNAMQTELRELWA